MWKSTLKTCHVDNDITNDLQDISNNFFIDLQLYLKLDTTRHRIEEEYLPLWYNSLCYLFNEGNSTGQVIFITTGLQYLNSLPSMSRICSFSYFLLVSDLPGCQVRKEDICGHNEVLASVFACIYQAAKTLNFYW